MEESWKSHFSAGLFLEEASPMLKKFSYAVVFL